MKKVALILLAAGTLFGCNKLKDSPELYGTWGASEGITDGHVLVISEDCSGHPLENNCNGSGDKALKVKVKDDVLKFELNGSTRYRYVITTYPTTATSVMPYYVPAGCIPVTEVMDTIYPGDTYMVLDYNIYLRKRP